MPDIIERSSTTKHYTKLLPSRPRPCPPSAPPDRPAGGGAGDRPRSAGGDTDTGREPSK